MGAEGVAERLERILAVRAAACRRVGRDPESARLLAVSKTFPPDAVAEAARAGLICFGESKVQEARQKIPQCAGNLRWHMVGHLQRNKVREAVGLFEWLHAVDSWRLLETLEAAAEEAGRALTVCLEVNVAGESSKFGMAPAELPGVVAQTRTLRRVTVAGLMTLPPFTVDPEGARPYFRRLRELRDACEAEQGVALPELSMGMSHDFVVAVEEGATWLRVGTALFGARVRPVRNAAAGGGPEDGA